MNAAKNLVRPFAVFLVLPLALTFVAVVSAGPAEIDPAKSEVLAASRAFSEAFVRNDMAALGELYTEDARLLPPARLVRGREEIRKFFAHVPGRTQLAHEMRSEELFVSGEVAVDSGTWFSTVKRGEAEPAIDSERYLAVWQRGADRRWRMKYDMWHRSAPTAPAVTDPPLASVVLPPELDRVLRDYEKAWSARDPRALAALFAEDGYVLSGGAPPVAGRAAIEKRYAGSGGPLALRAFHFRVDGQVGYILGGYGGKAGDPDDGKFTLTLRRNEQGRWLIVSDMDNSNRPPRG